MTPLSEKMPSRLPWKGNKVPEFMRSIPDTAKFDSGDHPFKNRMLIKKLYLNEKNRLREDAISTYANKGQLFFQMCLSLSFYAELQFEVLGNFSFLTVCRGGLRTPNNKLAAGEYVAEVDNYDALNIVSGDLDRLGVWEWPSSPYPDRRFGFDGWRFRMSIGGTSGIIHTGDWCATPPDYEFGKISVQVIELVRVLAPAFGQTHYCEEIEEIARRIIS